MKKNVIVLETEFEIDDIIEPILNDCYEKEEQIFYTVVGFEIVGISNGMVTDYLVKAQGQGSDLAYFYKGAIRKK